MRAVAEDGRILFEFEVANAVDAEVWCGWSHDVRVPRAFEALPRLVPDVHDIDPARDAACARLFGVRGWCVHTVVDHVVLRGSVVYELQVADASQVVDVARVHVCYIRLDLAPHFDFALAWAVVRPLGVRDAALCSRSLLAGGHADIADRHDFRALSSGISVFLSGHQLHARLQVNGLYHLLTCLYDGLGFKCRRDGLAALWFVEEHI